MIYSTLIRPLAFRLDPETAHHLAIAAGARLRWAAPMMRAATQVDDDRLKVDVDGLRFPSPIGLAAGFDKSGAAISALAGLGFGSIEIGSVSVDSSQGNPKPRLWRLPDDNGIRRALRPAQRRRSGDRRTIDAHAPAGAAGDQSRGHQSWTMRRTAHG
jgi:dihydroorotate dehydrogenase (fumarate)/dihydroorotate dehydrogenase